jgi:hypothetical protein
LAAGCDECRTVVLSFERDESRVAISAKPALPKNTAADLTHQVENRANAGEAGDSFLSLTSPFFFVSGEQAASGKQTNKIPARTYRI